MYSNNILEFLENYKNLDELCRQILSSNRGISDYIDEMSKESRGYQIAGWERDYKKLKKMRWIRNCLVHETDSFDDNLVNVEDIEWLHTFYHRIIDCSDPFSILYQSEKLNEKKANRKSNSEICFSIEDVVPSTNGYLPDRNIILAGVFLIGILGIIFLFLFIII